MKELIRRRLMNGKVVSKNDYLTIVTNNASISFTKKGTGIIEYSYDAITWNELSSSLVLYGEYTTYYRGDLRPTGESTDGVGTFSINGTSCELKGNCMSLLFGDNANGASLDGINYAFSSLFYNCDITSVSSDFLSSEIAYSGCYMKMFYGCTKLASVPSELLPASTTYPQCYYEMFRGCTSLINSPTLSSNTIYASSYKGMFYGCTSLLRCPELNAINLSSNCYDSMFYDCKSLTAATELNATTLANYCYQCMFAGCTSLTNPPSLPATTLAIGCYFGMFQNCTALTTAPALPATTLVSSCYYAMFQGCSNLNFIEMMATNIYASSCMTDWVKNVASSGTFIKNANARWTTTGNNGVPTGWTIIKDVPDAIKNYCVIVVHDGYVQFTFNQDVQISSTGTSWSNITAGGSTTYSTGAMLAIKANGVVSSFITTEGTGYFSLYGNAMGLLYGDSAASNTFAGAGAFSSAFKNNTRLRYVSKTFLPATSLGFGSYQSMFEGCTNLLTAPDLPATSLGSNCYQYMFKDCENLLNPPKTLPATTLYAYCYAGMFQRCDSLPSAPSLPATTMANYCYNDMFSACNSLTAAPQLPATTLADSCYRGMFQSCEFSTTPILPATTLAAYCYRDMFKGCVFLTTIQSISASTLADGCCWSMFENCTSLKSAPTINTSIVKRQCYMNMFRGCTSLTTAPALPAMTLDTYCYANMFYGCTSLQTAPTLPANTPIDGCYQHMFENCTNLIYIKVMLTGGPYGEIGTELEFHTRDWVLGLYYQNGTFVRHKNSTWATYSATHNTCSGKPRGWTEKTATS
jgi:hypothetical protein